MNVNFKKKYIHLVTSYVFINICKQIICFVKDIGLAKIIRNFILIYWYVLDFILLNSFNFIIIKAKNNITVIGLFCKTCVICPTLALTS